MNFLRWNTIVILIIGGILGGVAGLWTGYTWNKPVAEPVPVTGYRVTPHVLRFYELLRTEHIPIPESYTQGMAGKDYCLNVAHWYISIQYFISLGQPREQVKAGFLPMLQYEFAHDWLGQEDMDKLLGYIAIAPLYGPTRENLGTATREYCEQNRAKAEEIQV